MPNKRKRGADDEDSNPPTTPLSEGRPKRRRNDTTLVDTIQFIFDALRNQKKEDDSYMCEAFLRVPRKKNEPQYYEMIKTPIDMLKIQQKIKTDIYNELDEFCSDVQLLVENAKLYYAKSTDEYNDACELLEVFQLAKDRSGEELEKMRQQQQEDDEGYGRKKRGRLSKAALASSAPMVLEEDGMPMSVDDAVEELFGAIITAMDQDGRLYSYDFQFLPARETYPDYYNVIKNPIDLKTIAHRIQTKFYNSLEMIEKDISLMCENAFTYNEPGSRIYKDARSISRLVELRKQDLAQILNCKDSVRLRSKRAPGDRKWSELLDNLQEGEVLPLPEEEDQEEVNLSTAGHEDDDSDDEYDANNPLWQLFMAAKSLVLPSEVDYPLIEPFRRLPSRRWHSDYYQEIKNPISLTQIRKKFKKMEYITLSDMVEDFNLMLDNAQQYNRPDSKIHRDASKLQKYIRTKAIELSASLGEEVKQESESDTDEDENSSGFKRKSTSRPWTFKRRAKILFKTLMDYMTDDGRQPIVAFIEKPSKKDYPDYYEIISSPIDMETIETKIKTEQYESDDELISDFKLMFANCHKYNEECSVIHQDANILSKVLRDKIGELQLGGEASARSKVAKKNKYSAFVNMSKAARLLYATVREYRDTSGRQLSDVFLKLPPKGLYPDYYEVIKQPIDLERILQKWKNNSYNLLEDMLTDLTLVFQNACRYNEPESQIYRDALTLQRLMLQKRLELCGREEIVPNVAVYVQEMLFCIFISVFNHEDANGRYTAESFAELPEYEEVEGQRSRAVTFDILKRRLDRGLYTRLDTFQEDLLSIFNRARRLSFNNPRIYQDAVALQKEYIKVRDELTRHGVTLESRALNFKLADFEVILNQEGVLANIKEDVPMEVDPIEDANDTMTEDDDSKASIQPSDGSANSSAKHNEIQYYVGDFVYLTPPEKNVECPIVHVQRLWTNASGQQMLYGSLYYRPVETFHVPNRKFYEREIFKTERQAGYLLSEVVGKCIALPVSDYPKLRVEGFQEKDIYVCESRYSTKNRIFKKIKSWPFSLPEHIKLIERSQPMEMKKIESIFKERIEKHKEEIVDSDEETKPRKQLLPNVVKANETDPKNSIYFYQYNIASGVLILGDFVYIRSATGRAIRHVTRMWVTQEGNAFVTGLKYVKAHEITLSGDRTPYPAEVYLTAVQESFPLSDIIGKCSVLHIKDYVSLRHTEIQETDVYICERLYDEVNQRICNLQSGILKFAQVPEVTADELYNFAKPLSPSKLETYTPYPVRKTNNPVLQRNMKLDADAEDSLDGPPNSVTSADSSIAATPRPQKKASANRKTGLVSGYNMFSSDIRKKVTVQNPEANFGEISRLVGIEWKRLTETERKAFEDRAFQTNQENAEKALNDPNTPIMPNVKGPAELPLPNNADVVFECLWDTCDYMFEDLADLYDHLLAEPTGHVHKVTVFECGFRGCSRHKKHSLAPFPLLQRLMRHMREVHIAKNTGRIIQQHDRSRNFLPSTRRSLLNDSKPASPAPTTGASGAYNLMPGLNVGRDNQYQITIGAPIEVNGQSKVNGAAPQRCYDPIFVAPPAKTQRLLHSEAYIKYIENLDKSFVGNWDRQLGASVDNTVINETNRLPTQWLPRGAGNHGTVINALWALREYMMKDSLGIAKVL